MICFRSQRPTVGGQQRERVVGEAPLCRGRQHDEQRDVRAAQRDARHLGVALGLRGNTKGYSSTYLAMGFANVRAGTQKRRGISTRVPFCIQSGH